MNNFQLCDSFHTDQTLLASGYYIANSMANIQKSYIRLFYLFKPSHLRPATSRIWRKIDPHSDYFSNSVIR